MSQTQLTAVNGVGPATAKHLAAHGLDSAEALAAASIEDIAAVPGFGPARATAVRQAASMLLAVEKTEDSAAPPAGASTADPSDETPAATSPSPWPEKPKKAKANKKNKANADKKTVSKASKKSDSAKKKKKAKNQGKDKTKTSAETKAAKKTKKDGKSTPKRKKDSNKKTQDKKAGGKKEKSKKGKNKKK